MTKRFGFTLAEVLITLTIIGVIASMTVPTLLSNTADQEFKTGLKKAVSTINQAITMQYALEGTDVADYFTWSGDTISAHAQGGGADIGSPDGNGTGYFADGNLIHDLFAQRMQIVDSRVGRSGGASAGSATNAALYLSDGMVLEFPAPTLRSAACEDNKYSSDNRGGCIFSMRVDVNGDKGKCQDGGYEGNSANREGKVRPKDCFLLDVYADGVRPSHKFAKEIMYEGK